MKLLQPLPPMPASLGDRPAQFPITKTSNGSHFHIPLIFCSLVSQPCSIRYFFLFLIPFLILEMQKNAVTVESLYHKDSNTFRLLNKVKSCSADIVLGWVTTYEYPCCNNFFFSFFFLLPFSRRY